MTLKEKLKLARESRTKTFFVPAPKYKKIYAGNFDKATDYTYKLSDLNKS